MEIFLSLAATLILGTLLARAAKYFKLPNVTGYLFAGVLFGPSLSSLISGGAFGGVLSQEFLDEALYFITNITLGFIAFQIGSQFKLSYLKKIGGGAVVIAALESLLASVLVFFAAWAGSALGFYEYNFNMFILVAAVAAATAPGVTIMVVNQYKARGRVTDTLMSVVAIDDATCLIIFSVAMALAAPSGNSGVAAAVLKPLLEIGIALGIGFALGFIFSRVLKFFKDDGSKLILICAFLTAGIGLSVILDVPTLLLCMAFGATFANCYKYSTDIINVSDTITPPLFVIFYTLSGAQFDLSAVITIGVIGVLYIIFRVAGKVIGSYIGAAAAKSPPEVKKYLGWTLFPQGGVEIGLATIAASALGGFAGAQLKAIVLCAVLVYELTGPLLTKVILVRSGDIILDPSDMSKKQRRAFEAKLAAAAAATVIPPPSPTAVPEPETVPAPQIPAVPESVTAPSPDTTPSADISAPAAPKPKPARKSGTAAAPKKKTGRTSSRR